MTVAFKRVALALFLALNAVGPSRAETFDPVALTAQIANLAPAGYGAPNVVTLSKDSDSYELEREFEIGLRAIVTFQENVTDSPKKLSYFVFDTPESMQAGNNDFLLDMFQFAPEGLQGEDGWGAYGYTGNEPGAEKQRFYCANARGSDGKRLNANCGDFSEGSQTVVLASFTWSDAATEVTPDFFYFHILPEVHTAVQGLEKAKAALRQPETDSSAVATDIDPNLVGNWETYISLGSRWSLFRLEIGTAGRYSFLQDGVPGHSGRFEAGNGQWTMTSETNGWRDFGSYQMPDSATFNMMSQLGPSTWRRVGP